jgi:hypothetical protein
MRKFAALVATTLSGLAGWFAGYLAGAFGCQSYLNSQGRGASHQDAFVNIPGFGMLVGVVLGATAARMAWRLTRGWHTPGGTGG